jgi:CheY-like chemotaxis protein
LLSFDFEIVGTANDGYRAVEAAQRLDPDLIALDITMPGRDGFQTAQDLVQIGSRARIVFLTMHDSDDYVSEGFRSGGRGYVLKTRLHLDLATALQRVHAGQLFLPSLGSLFAIDSNVTGHTVQLFDDEHGFVDDVGDFLNAALRRQDSVSLVSTPSIRAGVAERLQSYGWKVGELGMYDQYHAADAMEAVSSIVRNGCPDADCIRELVNEIERARVKGPRGAESRMTFVGDVSSHLVRSGNSRASMELEQIWTTLTSTLPFLTVCCYPTAPFAETGDGVFPELCAQHFAVTRAPATGHRSLRL